MLGEIRSSFDDEEPHRYLRVDNTTKRLKKGYIGHILLDLINRLEIPLEEENVSGYDLIIFYIREGYVPAKRKGGLTSLNRELVDYLRKKANKEPIDMVAIKNSVPATTLRFEPDAAQAYWAELKRLSEYGDSITEN